MLGYLKKGFHILNVATKTLQKIILVIAVIVAVVNLFFYFMFKDRVVAHHDPILEQRRQIHDMISDPRLQETEQGQFYVWLHKKFFCTTLGEACSDRFEPSPSDLSSSYLGRFSNMFVSVYANPPASGSLWVYEGLQKSGLVPQTYAQGIGFYALQPLAPIWKMFRDLSYLLLVLVVIVVGFMIMFRAQINAQTEIAITNVLPRIVIAMLLISFSFAIAGFLIDFMYIVMGLGASIVSTSFPNSISNAQGMTYNIFAEQGTGLFNNIVGNGNIWKTGGALISLIPAALQGVLRGIIGTITIIVLNVNNPGIKSFLDGEIFKSLPWLGSLLGFLLAHGFGKFLTGLITGVLIPYIISFIVFTTSLLIFFRIFLMLLMTYIKILISIIFAPIILLFEAVPGQSTFVFWFKGLFFNIMTFPIVAILIMVTGLIAETSKFNWFDPLVGTNIDTPATSLWTPPFLYSADAEGFMMLVAVGIMFIIPDLVAFIKKSFGVEELPFNITPGTFLQGGGVLAAGASGLVMRSRALTREFGFYDDDKNKSPNWIKKVFFTKNPYPNLTRQTVVEGSKDVSAK